MGTSHGCLSAWKKLLRLSNPICHCYNKQAYRASLQSYSLLMNNFLKAIGGALSFFGALVGIALVHIWNML